MAKISAERLLRMVAETIFSINGFEINITISIRLGEVSRGEKTNELYNRVDKALYLAKDQGRNRLEISQSNFIDFE